MADLAAGRIHPGAAAPGAGDISILPFLFMISLLVPFEIRLGDLALNPYRVLLVLTFIPLMIRLLTGAAGRLVFADFAMMFAALWLALSLLTSDGRGSPIEAAGSNLVDFLGAYLVGRTSVRSAEGFRKFVQFYLLAMMVLLPFAALESLTQRPVLLELLPSSIDPTYKMEPRMGLRRAQVAFAHPILFGVFASTAFGLFWWVSESRGRRIIASGVAAMATFFSLSTGALISLVIQCTLISWEYILQAMKKRWRLFAILTITAYVGIDLLSNRTPFHVLVTYASFNTGSAYNRILIWNYGVENVMANPLFGLGRNVGNWSRPAWMVPSIDNFWLYFTMTYGLPAVIAFSSAVITIIRGAAKADLADPLARKCRAGFLTSMAGIIVAGGTVHYWGGVFSFLLFFLGSAVWLFNTDQRAPDEDGDGMAETDSMPVPDKRNVPQYTRFPSKPGSKAHTPVQARTAPSKPAARRPATTRHSKRPTPPGLTRKT